MLKEYHKSIYGNVGSKNNSIIGIAGLITMTGGMKIVIRIEITTMKLNIPIFYGACDSHPLQLVGKSLFPKSLSSYEIFTDHKPGPYRYNL